MSSLTKVDDHRTRSAIRELKNEIRELQRRLDSIQTNPNGPMSGTLPASAKKATSAGNKNIPAVNEVTNHVGGEDVAAGGLAIGNDLDDVPDGTSHGRVLNTELASNQVKRIRKVVAGLNVDVTTSSTG